MAIIKIRNQAIDLDAAEIPNLDTAKITTGTFADARISESSVSQHATTFDDNKIQSNIALLGFKTAVNGSLAKYNLQDQIIDEYEDNSGIDTSASTNETLAAGAYSAKSTVTPTVTEDSDDSGVDGDYTWYKWTDTSSTGSYNTDTTQSHEYLIVGGGGSGGMAEAGGGGAGGYLASTGLSLTGGNAYTVTVGAGGAGITSSGNGNDGSDSIISGTGISTLTADGGGYGSYAHFAGGDGGSGGGSGYNAGTGTGGTPTAGQGYAGGSGAGGTTPPGYGGGGGGGAGAVGVDGTSTTGGDGGIGIQNDISGTNTWYAGGGGGARAGDATASAGNQGSNNGRDKGGGGRGAANDATTSTTYCDATANTGGGGGAAYHLNGTGNSGDGGSGIVILRRTTTAPVVENLTLQSTANTASSAATKADLIMLMENAVGTATINTDIKGYVTADGGSNWTEGTLVDEGTWGTNKKILAFHDATVTSGTDMRYKITTHNQVLSSLETKIHATSIGWKAA